MARPKQFSNPRTLTLTLEESDLSALNEVCGTLGISKSEFVRRQTYAVRDTVSAYAPALAAVKDLAAAFQRAADALPPADGFYSRGLDPGSADGSSGPASG